jgi:RNA ligase
MTNTISNIAKNFDIAFVKQFSKSLDNPTEFIKQTYDELEDEEGYVVSFNNGHRIKIKSKWYMRIHNTKELFFFEKNVWFLILNNELDDAKPFMNDEDKALVEDFANEMEQRVLKKALMMAEFIQSAKEKVHDKKTFALEIVPTLHNIEKRLAFKLWDGVDPKLLVRDFLAKHSNSQKNVDEMRGFLDGLNWKDFYCNTQG